MGSTFFNGVTSGGCCEGRVAGPRAIRLAFAALAALRGPSHEPAVTKRFSRNPDPLYFLKNQGVRPSLPDSIPFINLDVVAGNTRFSSMSSCQTLPGTGRWQVTDEE